jgi:hypothetical protein
LGFPVRAGRKSPAKTGRQQENNVMSDFRKWLFGMTAATAGVVVLTLTVIQAKANAKQQAGYVAT